MILILYLDGFIIPATKSKKFRPKGRGMENVLLANPWFPLQVYIFRPKGRGITPQLLLKNQCQHYLK